MRSILPVFLLALSTVHLLTPLMGFADDPVSIDDVDGPSDGLSDDHDLVPPDNAVEIAAENEEVDRPGIWPVSAAVQTRRINAAFNQYVFGGPGPDAIAAAKARLDFSLAQKIQSLDAICHLTDEQKQRLALAGRGDITRLLDRVQEMRKKFHVIYHKAEHVYDLDLLDRRTRDDWELLLAGPFGEQSLFTKTESNVLTVAQLAMRRNDSLQSAGPDPAAKPRIVHIRYTQYAVDFKRLGNGDFDLDELLGVGRTASERAASQQRGNIVEDKSPARPTRRLGMTAIIEHDVEKTAEWAELRRRVVVTVGESGNCYFCENLTTTIGGQSGPVPGLVSGCVLSITPTIEPNDRLRMTMNLSILSKSCLAFGAYGDAVEALGRLNCVATCPSGGRVVISSFPLQHAHRTTALASRDKTEMESLNEKSPNPARHREMVVILTAEIDREPGDYRDPSRAANAAAGAQTGRGELILNPP